MKQLLFITHEATRSGAPMLLLNLIKWFSENKDSEFRLTILAVKGGPLINEYEKYGTVVCYNKKYSLPFDFFNSFFNKRNQKKIISKLKASQWNLIFSNTIVNGKLLELLANNVTPVISYIHELEFSIKNFQKKDLIKGTFLHTNYFICGSEIVKKNLIENHQVKSHQAEVVHSFANISHQVKNVLISNEIKRELSIPIDAFVVGMLGNLIWRKGPEFFIETASLLATENIVFLWVGANNQEYLEKIKYDYEVTNKKINILFLPPTADYIKYYHVIDLFFLSSREDPYPMVMVEATSYGIPLICFDKAGGAQEFIDDKIGFIVPYGDVKKAAKKINYFYNNKHLLDLNKNYIQEQSIKQHDVERNALKIFKIIEKFLC